METTPRIRSILNLLLSNDQSVTDQEIADELGVSSRTVLREMDYIATILKSFDLTLVRKKGEGSRVLGESEDKDRLRKSLGTDAVYAVSDKARRRDMLKFELLRSREPQKLYYYSDMFGVSEATISNDIDALEKWAAEAKLTIVRKPGYGIMLSGGERDYRAAMRRVISEAMETEKLMSLGDNIYNLMNEEVLSGVGETLEEIDAPYIKLLTNDAYLGLLIHLAVAVERIRQGEYISPDDVYDASLEDGYDIAKQIAGALEKEFDITVPDEEINNILLHIRGAKLHYSGQGQVRSGIRGDELLGLIDSMIDVMEPDIARELKYEDDFIQGLMVHLETALYRLKNNMVIFNPLLDSIKSEYPDIFEDCKRAAQVITERTGLVPNEAEIGYLSMHFGAAKEKIESRRKKHRTVNVGVICASGFGLARLMLAKLSSKLSDCDVSFYAYGSDEITDYVTKKTDFFISSINVDALEVDYLMVSPMITAKDVQQIRGKIGEYALMQKKQDDTDFTRQLDEINDIIMKVKSIVKRYRHITLLPGMDIKKVIESLSLEATDNMRAAAVLRADLTSREKVMSQIFPELGVGLFHCNSRAVRESQVITAGVSDDDYFSSPQLKGIHTVLCMIIPYDDERRQNAQLMGRISSALVEDEDFLEILKNEDEEGIRKKLQDILKGYFTELLNDI